MSPGGSRDAKRTERGFAIYAETENEYGKAVVVESSRACCEEKDGSITGPWVWLQTYGHAHLSVEEARVVRDGLDVFVREAEESCDWVEPQGRSGALYGSNERRDLEDAQAADDARRRV